MNYKLKIAVTVLVLLAVGGRIHAQITLNVKAGALPALQQLDTDDLVINDNNPNGNASLVVPLSEKKLEGTPFGIGADLNVHLTPRFQVVLDGNIGFPSGGWGYSLLGGVNYNVLGDDNSFFQLGLTPKIGITHYELDLGNATIQGTPPFVYGSNEINNGDPIQGVITPFVVQVSATIRLRLTDKLHLNLQPGYGSSIDSSEMKIKSKDKVIETTSGSGAFVNVGGVTLTAGIEFSL